MSRLGQGFRYWLPVLLWMAVIFMASTDLMSSQKTSRFIGPLLRFFIPDIRPETIAAVQFVARKGGHLTEYAILTILAWRALVRPGGGVVRPWNWRPAAAAFAGAVIYAVTDEWHQRFVGSRFASIWDVGIDAAGAVIGLILAWIWHKRVMRARSSMTAPV